MWAMPTGRASIPIRVRSPNLSPSERTGRAHADTRAGLIVGVDEDDASIFKCLLESDDGLDHT